MSAIRIEHGSAEVIVHSDDISYSDGRVVVFYSPDDLMAAVVAALRAMPQDRDRHGLMSRTEDWLKAIEQGAESRGLSL